MTKEMFVCTDCIVYLVNDLFINVMLIVLLRTASSFVMEVCMILLIVINILRSFQLPLQLGILDVNIRT